MASKGKRKLVEMSFDDFVKKEFDVSNEDDYKEKKEKPTKKTKSSIGKQNERKEKSAVMKVKEKEENMDVDESKQHRKALQNLKESDPEFCKYLEENDEAILNFDSSSEDEESGLNIQEEKMKKGKKRETKIKNEANEDDDDDEERRHKDGMILVTMKMIDHWTDSLKSDAVTLSMLKETIEVFRAAVQQVQGGKEKDSPNCLYIVEDAEIFNAIVRMCVVYLLPAMNQFMKRSHVTVDKNKPLSSFKPWKKVYPLAKYYLRELLKVLVVVTTPAIVSVLLKHVVQLVPYISADQKLSKLYTKKLTSFWSSGEETVRVLAFIAIVKITRQLPGEFYESVLKSMYMAYVSNAKFTSPSTWPMINFMRRSLVEFFALDIVQAYQYAFVYIRQLAIHLRNAITMKQKDSTKTVYNWQYIHCLHFLAQLLANLYSNEELRPLIYPLVQIIMGTMKLIPSTRYFPLRFHCIRILILLSRETETFIPVLPFIMEAVETTNFNSRHQRSSFKPLDFSCMLKLSKAQLTEQGFKDGVLDEVYDLVVQYMSCESHSIGFPELVLPTVLQLKAFLKKCKVSNFTKVVKQLLEKIDENSKAICENRKNVSFNLKDSDAVNAWETQMKLSGTPMSRYYEQYRKLREREITRGNSHKDRESKDGLKLPVVKNKKLNKINRQKNKYNKQKNKNNRSSDSDDEGSFDEDRFSEEVDEIDEGSDESR